MDAIGFLMGTLIVAVFVVGCVAAKLVCTAADDLMDRFDRWMSE